MKFKRILQKTTCLAVSAALVACTSTREYASVAPKSEVKSPIATYPCKVKALEGSTAKGYSSYWSGTCGIDGAEGTGLAVWKDSQALKARYTGPVKGGVLDGKGSFLDAKIEFNGVVQNGLPFLGVWSELNGQRFEGRFDSQGNYAQGVLHQPDGSAIAGNFNGTQPIGTFVIRDTAGKLWYGEMRNGQIVKRAKVSTSSRSSVEALAALGLVLLAGGAVAMLFAATGAALIGGAALAAAANPARIVLIAIV